MNIHEAARQLEQAAITYTARTADGAYRLPLSSQRPLFLIGPPGVGKTAVVAQVAEKLGIGYAAYTMTHHTRQSALGLPLIVQRTLNGREQAVTEYTMSEIVSDVWRRVEAGAETGILFLDEINCVSESLMPAMLQLLQYKTFGTHPLPRGWMIVCAGNPPRYNRYVHLFDAVVLDRLRVIQVEPDLETWLSWASARGVHPVVRSYLTLHGDDFYATDGDRIVTTRSWTDLSGVLLAMQAEGLDAGEELYGQYLQVDEVAGRFAMYARLCEDIGGRLDEALSGAASVRMDQLPFDEAAFAALCVASRLEAQAARADRERRRADRLGYFVQGVLRELPGGQGLEALYGGHLDRQTKALHLRDTAGIVDESTANDDRALLKTLGEWRVGLREKTDGDAAEFLRQQTEVASKRADDEAARLSAICERVLDFVERSFDDPNVRLILMSDLRAHAPAWRFLQARFPGPVSRLWNSCDPDIRES